jgi:hypothetical protein
MRHFAKSWAILFIVGISGAVSGQPSRGSANRNPSAARGTPRSGNPAATPSQIPPATAAAPGFGIRVAQGVLNATSDPDDHVRCFFTLKQLMDLRPVPGVAKLTEADQSKVLTSVAQAVDEADDKELTPDQKAKFISELANNLDGKLVGKTPGEALTTIMDLLYRITVKSGSLANVLKLPGPESAKQSVVAQAKEDGGNVFAQKLENDLNQDPKWFRAGDVSGNTERLKDHVAKVASELTEANKPAAMRLQSDLLNPGTDLLAAAQNKDKAEQEITNRSKKYGEESFARMVQEQLDLEGSSWFKPGDPKQTLNNIANVIHDIPEEHQATADKVVQKLEASGLTQVSGSVVSSARNELNKLAPPTDIGCAYQILSWEESRLMFGRSVADNFIGVQVTVRNLNAKEEFIVHNAMLSVDSDIHGAIGQYFEGVDKIGVEAYNNAGESLTVRGIIGDSIAAASTLLSTLQPIVDAENFGHAVAAFNGGVVPGWKTMSPDHQKDQLLLIANSGFSATYTTKTVVGKSGAATFYTWFPVKPLKQGWWIQDCAQRVVAVGDGQTKNTPQLGVDLVRARQECSEVTAANFKKEWKTKAYKNWSSISDQLFRDLSHAVVAGIHVQEDSKNKSSVAELKCPKNQRGELDLSKAASDGTINCDVTGENLDKVVKLRLENVANVVDPVRPEATVTVSGDNTTAKASFKVSDVASATGDTYNAYSVGKDGTEVPTGQNVHVDQKTITITGISPSKVDLGTPSNKVTLNGFNLNNLTQVCLIKSGVDSKLIFGVNKGGSKIQATMDVSSSKLSAGEWQIYLNDCSDSNDSKQKLVMTGAVVAAPAVAPAGAPQIQSFVPASASPGQTVTITGTNLLGVETVTFGGVAAKPTSVDAKKITVIVPSGAKSGAVGVTKSGVTKTRAGFKVSPRAGQTPPSKNQ